MKCTVQFALCLVLLSGCGASRRAIKSATEATREVAATTHIEAEALVSQETTMYTDLSEDEEVVTEVVEFDTTQPVDSLTGTPPVKRAIRQTRRTAATARQDVRADTEAVTKATVDTTVAVKEETTNFTQEQSRRGLNGWQQVLCYTGAAAIVALILWLVGRRLKRR